MSLHGVFCTSICYGCIVVSIYVTCKFLSPSADAFGGAAVVVDDDVLRGDDVEIRRPGGIVVQPMDSGFVEVNGLAVTDFESGICGGTAPPAFGVSIWAWTTTAVCQINVGKSDVGDGSDIVAVDVGCQRRLAANLRKMDSADRGRAWKFEIVRVIQLQIQKAFDVQLEIREGDVRNINAFVFAGCAVFRNDTDGCACFRDDDVGECAIAHNAVADAYA